MSIYQITFSEGSFAEPILGKGTRYTNTCPVCTRGGLPIPPVAVEFKRKRIPDFNFLSPDILVTDSVKEVFEQHQVTGVEYLEPMLVGNVNLLQGKTLWQLHVIGDAKASAECNIVLLSQCPECGERQYSTWDGGLRADRETVETDIFRIEEHGGVVFVNDKVKTLIEEYKFTNVDFVEDVNVTDFLSWMRPRP